MNIRPYAERVHRYPLATASTGTAEMRQTAGLPSAQMDPVLHCAGLGAQIDVESDVIVMVSAVIDGHLPGREPLGRAARSASDGARPGRHRDDRPSHRISGTARD